MRLFAALFLLLPGAALVASTYRHSHAMIAAVVLLFVLLHAMLHALAAWRAAAPRPLPRVLRRVCAQRSGVMLAATLLLLAMAPLGAKVTLAAITWLLLGGLCQVCGLRAASNGASDTLLVLGSALQFIAAALLSATATG